MSEKVHLPFLVHTTDRLCGPCQACCSLEGVEKLDKPDHQRCAHQREGVGCATYESRPESCRTFECLWRLGLLSLEDRPDRLGVMLDAYRTDHDDGATLYGATAWETEPGSFERARERLRELASRRPVLVHRFDKSFAWFDGEKLEAI